MSELIFSSLEANPLLVLFLVIAIGSVLGRINIYGFHLGVAAVLFAGLGLGALDNELKLPEIVYQIGLVLFVFSVGLTSGPALLANLKGRGLQANMLAVAALICCALLAGLTANLLEIGPASAAGLYAGSLTNTPALATVLDYLKASHLLDLLADPVVAYSAAYPGGVLIPIALIAVFARVWKIDFAEEARLEGLGAASGKLITRTICIANPEVSRFKLEHLVEHFRLQVIFGRVKHAEKIEVCTGLTRFAQGDIVTMVGPEHEIEQACLHLGPETSEQIDLDRSVLDYRRIFVSDPALTGRPISSLNLSRRFGAIISRIRRGDNDFIPQPGSMLQLGDRVRVVAQRERLPELSRYFGDSYQAVSELDVLAYTFGLALGIGLGLLPLPLPGGTELRLGLAGGPLMAALLLSALRRTGPFSWALPYSVNAVMSQLGLTLFLAGIGTRAGPSFLATISTQQGLHLLLAAAAISAFSSCLVIFVGYRFLKISFGRLCGILAGVHTQPAVLAFASEQAGNEAPLVGYSSVYPVATIAKIVIAQALVALAL